MAGANAAVRSAAQRSKINIDVVQQVMQSEVLHRSENNKQLDVAQPMIQSEAPHRDQRTT